MRDGRVGGRSKTGQDREVKNVRMEDRTGGGRVKEEITPPGRERTAKIRNQEEREGKKGNERRI